MTTLKTTLIKLAAGAVIVLAVLVYTQYLRGQNQRLKEQVSSLAAVNASNAAELARMRALAALNERALEAWEAAQSEINEQTRKAAVYVQKELQSNEDFNAWAGQPVPDAVDFMLKY